MAKNIEFGIEYDIFDGFVKNKEISIVILPGLKRLNDKDFILKPLVLKCKNWYFYSIMIGSMHC